MFYMKLDESEKDRALRKQIEETLSYMTFAFNPNSTASGTVIFTSSITFRWDLN